MSINEDVKIEDGLVGLETNEIKVFEADNHGAVYSEISGTPIVVNISGVDSVPTADNFTIDIGDFKPYEMLSNTIGNYKNIVKIAREFKQKE